MPRISTSPRLRQGDSNKVIPLSESKTRPRRPPHRAANARHLIEINIEPHGDA